MDVRITYYHGIAWVTVRFRASGHRIVAPLTCVPGTGYVEKGVNTFRWWKQ